MEVPSYDIGNSRRNLSFIRIIFRRLRNATNRINTAFFVPKNKITPHWIWYYRVV